MSISGEQQKMSLPAAIFKMKCPNCRKGDLFETPTWSFQKSFDMPPRCPVCQLNYFPEPGFYWGAMFVSYIIWGWMSVIFGGAGIIFLGLSVNQATGILILVSAIFFVWLFRISRSVWIHIAPGRSKPNKVK